MDGTTEARFFNETEEIILESSERPTKTRLSSLCSLLTCFGRSVTSPDPPYGAEGTLVYNSHTEEGNLLGESLTSDESEAGMVDTQVGGLSPSKICSAKPIFFLQPSTVLPRPLANVRPHQCKLCLKSFARKGDLKSHLRSHEQTQEPSHHCQFCQESFAQLKSLKGHIIGTHTGELVGAHQCQICSKAFVQRVHLRNHQMGAHTDDEGVYGCQLCPKSFGRLDYLEAHTRTHETGGLDPCKSCLKSFGQVGNLKRHMRAHSRGQPQ